MLSTVGLINVFITSPAHTVLVAELDVSVVNLLVRTAKGGLDRVR